VLFFEDAGIRCFAPVKNRKEHDVPLAASLVPILAEHIRRYPPVPVKLPLKEPDGDLVTFRLIVTRPDGRCRLPAKTNCVYATTNEL